MKPSTCQKNCQNALRVADQLCQGRGVRLTPQRRQVLEILCDHHKPMGAYDILDLLKSELPAAKPPTVYRALEFLLEQGLVHRLESLNAYVSCIHPEHPHASQFLICRDCGEVRELESRSVDRTLDSALKACGFAADSQVIEVTGRCLRCTERDPS
ncbi:MAG: transcriptional repressor [Sedimenticola sp.]|uniref:Ferric uptake regulation protein n=1 Tax=Sedimenticola thiotaurini TaxID=1543721 RepID=A0A558DAD4_9GAMM|nr:transcriptional repressor [Sedimenticola sp.]TVT57985.1 MAG: transcriptional repressor [Sedimenticola thiotaurini]MCW8882369.1 transcriptional repressor [Sedimenticola sp.]MCW8921161.1 transcriptional repressor [Sedimenticola sp.]MCW8947262.1 transcriptional repressor [Sedimenticola sp.]